jgi:gluconate 2-dehydrogenase gamma chain
MTDVHSRRNFLRAAAAAGAAWAMADLAHVDDALAAAARQATEQPGTFAALTADQAAVVDAAAARILPSVDGRPGAREAGAVYFIDRALSTFNKGQTKTYVNGVNDLNRRASRAGASRKFVALTTAQQDEILRLIEKTPFFQALRFDTIVGTFGSASWGGNRDAAGWRMLGFSHQPAFLPPFGYYDADAGTGR